MGLSFPRCFVLLPIILVFECPVQVSGVARPAGWVNDELYEDDHTFSSGLRCYDCLDCDEPFSYEQRDCFSAINCYVVRAQMKMSGFGDFERVYYKKLLPGDIFNKWYTTWYHRHMTFRGCADYGFNCTTFMERHVGDGVFRSPVHMMIAESCEECDTSLCNVQKTPDTPMVDRAIALDSEDATSIFNRNYNLTCIFILYGIVMIINALWA